MNAFAFVWVRLCFAGVSSNWAFFIFVLVVSRRYGRKVSKSARFWALSGGILCGKCVPKRREHQRQQNWQKFIIRRSSPSARVCMFVYPQSRGIFIIIIRRCCFICHIPCARVSYPNLYSRVWTTLSGFSAKLRPHLFRYPVMPPLSLDTTHGKWNGTVSRVDGKINGFTLVRPKQTTTINWMLILVVLKYLNFLYNFRWLRLPCDCCFYLLLLWFSTLPCFVPVVDVAKEVR